MNKKNLRLLIFLCLIIMIPVLLLQPERADVPPEPKSTPIVKTDGRHLYTDDNRDGKYYPYFIKGVAYSPTPVGRHPSDWGWMDKKNQEEDNILNDERILKRDFEYLRQMNVNTIRIWKADSTFDENGRFPNRMTQQTLDLAREYDLKVIPGFWMPTSDSQCVNGKKITHHADFKKPEVRQNLKERFKAFISEFKDHPAILFWAIGNENNLHLNPTDYEESRAFYSLVNEMASLAHDLEGETYHPVAFVNGEIHNIGQLLFGTHDLDMNALDIWGANVYRGDSFGSLFAEYKQKTKKPLWISEFGVDAFFAYDEQTPHLGREDQQTPAIWLAQLWTEILMNRNVTIGGTIMAYSDEWWMPNEWIDEGGHISTHDHHGIGSIDIDCDGFSDWIPPTPDKFYHSEWWGLMSVIPQENDIDQLKPRLAYHIMKEVFTCSVGERSYYVGRINNKSCDGSNACCSDLKQKSLRGTCVTSCKKL